MVHGVGGAVGVIGALGNPLHVCCVVVVRRTAAPPALGRVGGVVIVMVSNLLCLCTLPCGGRTTGRVVCGVLIVTHGAGRSQGKARQG